MARVDARAQVAQAALDVRGVEVGKERLRERVVGALGEALELERPRNDELGVLLLAHVARKLLRERASDQRALLLDAEVIARIEIADEVHAAPQRTARDVEEHVLRAK